MIKAFKKKMASNKWMLQKSLLLLLILMQLGCFRVADEYARKADALERKALGTYYHSGFSQATNDLYFYINFLNEARESLSLKRDVDFMLAMAELRLAYMFFFTSNTNSAFVHLAEGFQYVTRMKVSSGQEVPTKTNFASYTISAIEKLDDSYSKGGPQWKRNGFLNTNTVEVAQSFLNTFGLPDFQRKGGIQGNRSERHE
jgi:hypothetical protein